MRGSFFRSLALMATAVLLCACEGDDGAVGPSGPPGLTGPPGPTGPTSGLPISSAAKINVEITSVDVSSGGGAPVVELTLTNALGQGLKGLPAGNIGFIVAQLTPGTNGGSSAWRSYITGASAGISNAQAATETATAERFVDNGDGTYQYTFAQALTDYPGGPVFDAAKTHRVGIEIRTSSGDFLPDNTPANNAPYDFVPAGGAPTFTRAIVDNDTCNACHDNLELHGEARFDVDYCVQCHNPYSIDGDTVDEPWGGSVDMSVLTHKIHRGVNLADGYFIIGRGNRLHDYSGVVFPQDERNCLTCHDESDAKTPQASNWRTVVNRDACGSCHDAIDWAAGDHPGGIAFADDTFCIDCHGPDSTVNDGDLRTAIVHRIPEAIASGRFQFNILSVTNTAPGQNPIVRFSVTDPTNGDAPYDIQNDSEFTTCALGASRLIVGVSWDTVDYTNTGSGNPTGQPISMNPLTACGGASVAEGNDVFRVTSPTAIPVGTTGTLAVTMDGHPAVVFNGVVTRIGVTNVIEYRPVTDATAVPRRNAVAIEKCDDCHNRLSVHGNNRTDNIEVCVTCHNANATDINRRGPPCDDVLGADDETVDMKVLIHALHAAGVTEVPYEVCGFGNEPHTYAFAYPGRLNNCEGCHLPGGYDPVDPSVVLGTTIDVGADLASPTDDTVVSPNTAICSSCHVSNLAKQHMMQNGGDFDATKAPDSSLVSSSAETCELCHGPGRSSDVKTVHGVGGFSFN